MLLWPQLSHLEKLPERLDFLLLAPCTKSSKPAVTFHEGALETEAECSPDSQNLGIKLRNLLCRFHQEAIDPLSTSEGEASIGETAAKSNTRLCSPIL